MRADDARLPDLVVDVIERLRAQGAIYDVDSDMYFDMSLDDRFGFLGKLEKDQAKKLFIDFGGDPDRPGKRNPLDCLVWLQQRPGEPAWDTSLGRGRPGWHIECTAIVREYLGVAIDVQGGGSDLIFPHHEMCASQAHVAEPGTDFAKAYMHVGMIGYDGYKMSKSRGNLVLVSKLRAGGTDPMAIRMALLSRHYREAWMWTGEALREAKQRLADWTTSIRSGRGIDPEPTVREVRDALADDLNAPAALAAIDRWVATTAEPDSDAGSDSPHGRVISDLVREHLGIALA